MKISTFYIINWKNNLKPQNIINWKNYLKPNGGTLLKPNGETLLKPNGETLLKPNGAIYSVKSEDESPLICTSNS